MAYDATAHTVGCLSRPVPGYSGQFRVGPGTTRNTTPRWNVKIPLSTFSGHCPIGRRCFAKKRRIPHYIRRFRHPFRVGQEVQRKMIILTSSFKNNQPGMDAKIGVWVWGMSSPDSETKPAMAKGPGSRETQILSLQPDVVFRVVPS